LTLTIDGMVRNAEQGQKASVSASTRAQQATGALDAAQSLGQTHTTSVQLSVYGQVKSSFASLEVAARNLSMPAKTATPEDATKAAQSFTSSYNSAVKTVSYAIAANGGNAEANLASVDLGRVVTTGNNAADLKRAGINVAQDGTLSVDTQALQNAFQASPDAVLKTLALVGAEVGQVSGSVLANAANTASGVRTKSASLSSQPKAAATSKNTPQQQVAANGNASSGIAAYQEMISFR
jgi:hypothetical protein